MPKHKTHYHCSRAGKTCGRAHRMLAAKLCPGYTKRITCLFPLNPTSNRCSGKMAKAKVGGGLTHLPERDTLMV